MQKLSHPSLEGCHILLLHMEFVKADQATSGVVVRKHIWHFIDTCKVKKFPPEVMLVPHRALPLPLSCC